MTRNSRFAVSVHILAYLAYRPGCAIPSGVIAASVATNPVVIRRLLATLVTARIVHARKGASGGFRLVRPPQAISLLDIYRAADPKPRRVLGRFSPNHRCPVGARIESVLQGVFDLAQAGMEAELKQVTLADVEQQLHDVCPEKSRSA